MIHIHGLTKFYEGQAAVDGIDLTIPGGEKHVLIGTSGSGKTTLLKMMNGLVPKSSGTIIIHDKDTDEWHPIELRRRLGYIIQEVGLFPHYTVEQNIALIPTILRWKKSDIATRVREVMSMVGLDEGYLSMFPDALSGGQQQRVGIARALAADPDTLLMDEPFGALDPITRKVMQEEFKNLPGIKTKTTVLVTHDMMEAALLGECITLLDRGKIQQTGSLRSLLFSPANPFVSSFLSQQRDQLELQAISLKEMIPYLSTCSQPGLNSLISSSYSLSGIPEKDVVYEMQWENTSYHVHHDEILSLYYRHRADIVKKLKSDGR
jgi:osmoprotectant transport system ATP-binding protein